MLLVSFERDDRDQLALARLFVMPPIKAKFVLAPKPSKNPSRGEGKVWLCG
jgi:hypothetical protein